MAGGFSISISIDQAQINHVNIMLHQAPEKAKRVFKNAFNRGLITARTQAAKEVKQRYDITEGNLRPNQNIRLKMSADAGAGVVGEISFSGAKIPLYRFNPSPKTRTYTTRYVNGVGGWRITTAVSAADNKGQMIRRKSAFIATFKSGHTGIFARTGGITSSGKDRIREYWGYSIADMLDYEPAREEIEKKTAETVEKRIDHELLQVLSS